MTTKTSRPDRDDYKRSGSDSVAVPRRAQMTGVYAPDPADGKWGALGRLGFIELSTSIALSADLPSALPPGVTALLTRLRLPDGEVSVRALERMVSSSRLEEATRELADVEVDVVAFACTTGSLIGGVGFDRKVIQRME